MTSDSRRSGLILAEIVPHPVEGFDLRVSHTFDDPRAIRAAGIVLSEITRRWSATGEGVQAASEPRLADQNHPKRGGPTGTPEDERIEIAQGWLRVRGRMNQEVYAATRGISASTLRRWLTELRERGRL